ncbi:MAG: hypothetical protein H7269_12350 [Cellulomonas sp.]|nr:hypothetical protein [Cellulomonas sp.]
MNRTRAGRRATALPWTATLIAPIALIVVASFGAGSAYVRTLPAVDADVAHLADAARVADLAVLDGLEPLRADRLGDDR